MSVRENIRELHTFNYVANQAQTFDLPRDHLVKSYYLVIRASIDVGDGDEMVYAVPLSLIRRIRVAATGRHILKDMSAYGAFLQAQRVRGEKFPWYIDHATEAAAISNATVPIDFGMFDAVDEGSFYLPTYMFDGLEFQIIWGNDDNVHPSGNTIVEAGTTPTATLYVHELDRKSLLEERGGTERNYLINKETELSQNIDSANADYNIKYATGNLWRSIYYMVYGTPTGGICDMPVNLNDISEADPQVVLRAQLNLGRGEVYRDLPFQNAYNMLSRIKRNVSAHVGPTILGTSGIAGNAGPAVTRFADPGLFVDFAENGMLNGCVNTAGRNSWEFIGNVATPVNALVPTPRRIVSITREILPM